MREIKFRAWSKENKGWIAGFNMLNFHSFYNKGMEPSLKRYDSEWKLSEVELLQYAGLKDKNGKEIYEGDILLDDCKRTFEVKFGKLPLDKRGDCVCTYSAFYAKDNGITDFPYYECNQIGEWMEIIGNIYENADLLTPPTKRKGE